MSEECCELCGCTHNVEPITFEDAVKGAVIADLLRSDDPTYEIKRHNFLVALEKVKKDMVIQLGPKE